MQKVTASIIICTCNRAESLAETLRSLSMLKVPSGLDAELIVVDNGSTDNTRDMIEQAENGHIPRRRIYEQTPGLSRARNAGIAAAQGDILVFADDDVRVHSAWLKHLISPIIEGQADAVAGGVRIAAHLRRDWMKDRHLASLADTSVRQPSGKPELVGANMAFSREVLQRVPGFDTDLGAGTPRTGEETLFSLQLLEAGYTISSALNNPIEHRFEPARLKRESFLSEVKRCGRFFAYLDYHWEHRDVKAFSLRRVRSRLRLAAWRWLNPGELTRVEGVSERELEYVFSVAYYEELSKIAGEPRLYDLHGLAKRTNTRAPQPAMVRAA